MTSGNPQPTHSAAFAGIATVVAGLVIGAGVIWAADKLLPSLSAIGSTTNDRIWALEEFGVAVAFGALGAQELWDWGRRVIRNAARATGIGWTLIWIGVSVLGSGLILVCLLGLSQCFKLP